MENTKIPKFFPESTVAIFRSMFLKCKPYGLEVQTKLTPFISTPLSEIRTSPLSQFRRFQLLFRFRQRSPAPKIKINTPHPKQIFSINIVEFHSSDTKNEIFKFRKKSKIIIISPIKKKCFPARTLPL